LVIKALFKKAKKGDVRASEVLFDRAWGKAKQDLKIEGSPVVTGFQIFPASVKETP